MQSFPGTPYPGLAGAQRHVHTRTRAHTHNHMKHQSEGLDISTETKLKCSGSSFSTRPDCGLGTWSVLNGFAEGELPHFPWGGLGGAGWPSEAGLGLPPASWPQTGCLLLSSQRARFLGLASSVLPASHITPRSLGMCVYISFFFFF